MNRNPDNQPAYRQAPGAWRLAPAATDDDELLLALVEAELSQAEWLLSEDTRAL